MAQFIVIPMFDGCDDSELGTVYMCDTADQRHVAATAVLDAALEHADVWTGDPEGYYVRTGTRLLAAMSEPEALEVICRLIARSVSRSEVVYADWSPELAAEIENVSEGSIDNGTVVEYCGRTPSGAKWFVCLRRAA